MIKPRKKRKEGDQFRVVEPVQRFEYGEIVELYRDDGSGAPYFVATSIGMTKGGSLNIRRLKPLRDPKWTTWQGGYAPPVHQDMFIEVLKRNGTIKRGSAWIFDWRHDRLHTDIMGYRLVEEKTTEVEWDGEGLPPVGCRCEYAHRTSDSWNVCTVIGYFEDWVWLHASTHTVPHSVKRDIFRFQPISTAREKAVKDMLRITESMDSRRQAMVALYKAGYRKVHNNPEEQK